MYDRAVTLATSGQLVASTLALVSRVPAMDIQLNVTAPWAIVWFVYVHFCYFSCFYCSPFLMLPLGEIKMYRVRQKK